MKFRRPNRTSTYDFRKADRGAVEVFCDRDQSFRIVDKDRATVALVKCNRFDGGDNERGLNIANAIQKALNQEGLQKEEGRWNELSLRQQVQVIELVNHLASNPAHTVSVVSELDGKGQDVLKEEMEEQAEAHRKEEGR